MGKKEYEGPLGNRFDSYEEDEYFGCHPCINTSSIRLKVSDVFQKFLQEIDHEYTIVQLGKEE